MSALHPSFITVKPKDSKNDEDTKQQHESFHQAAGPALFLGQIFGMLPVDGVLGKSEMGLNFRWKSPRTIYAIFFLFCGTIESCLGTRRLLRLGFNIHFAETLLFFILAMIRAYMVFYLGKKWNVIMMKWRKYEDAFLREPYKTIGWSLSWKIRVIFLIAFSLVMSEHVLFLLKSIDENLMQLERCSPKSNNFWENFVWRNRPHLAFHFPYSPYELPLYEWINLLQAFSWSYSDILVLMLSIGIKFRFDQLNQYFERVSKNEDLMTPENFRKLRIHYYQLVDLTYYIDSQISTLILLSLGHNMLVFIIKIFGALNPIRFNFLDDLYFWCYIIFLALRIFGTLLSCSNINDAASSTIIHVRNIPSTHWTIDLKRLFDTISIEAPTLTFSGQKFFFITKTMILGMLGAIVTFELVLLDEIREEKGSFCSFIDY